MTRPGAGVGRAATGEPEVVVVADPAEASRHAAERIAAALTAAVGRRGRADWVTTGGSTPRGIYRHLATPPLRDRVPWRQVHLWWGDDRFVARGDPLSNVRPADETLLAHGSGGGASIPAANVHAIPMAEAMGAGVGPERAAARYDTELRAAGDDGLDVVDGMPVFDVVLVGIGGDGHLLSVFPGSPTWDAEAWAIAVPSPTHVEPHVARVTLHPGVLAVARQVLAVAFGDGKAAVLARIFGAERDPRRWPAQAALAANATWILDVAAAARLPR